MFIFTLCPYKQLFDILGASGYTYDRNKRRKKNMGNTKEVWQMTFMATFCGKLYDSLLCNCRCIFEAYLDRVKTFTSDFYGLNKGCITHW